MPDFAEQGVTTFIPMSTSSTLFYNCTAAGEFRGNQGGAIAGELRPGFAGVLMSPPRWELRLSCGFHRRSPWGVDSGPYVMLPVFGPRNVRSAVGYFTDTYTSIPYLVNEQTWAWTFWTVEVIDYRARLLDAEDLITGDRYIFFCGRLFTAP